MMAGGHLGSAGHILG